MTAVLLTAIVLLAMRLLVYKCVLGCAYPHDPMHPPAWYIRWLIEKNLVPGAIVILHDGISNPTRSIQALPHILTAGHERGLRFVTIGDLERGNQPKRLGVE